jgi:hypothetical protein
MFSFLVGKKPNSKEETLKKIKAPINLDVKKSIRMKKAKPNKQNDRISALESNFDAQSKTFKTSCQVIKDLIDRCDYLFESISELEKRCDILSFGKINSSKKVKPCQKK